MREGGRLEAGQTAHCQQSERSRPLTASPPWARDELILALDLYFHERPDRISQQHPSVVALSGLLGALPIHPDRAAIDSFRSPNAVYMKLCNFLHLDPDYHGLGLRRVSGQDREIWREFAEDRTRLHAIAEAIRRCYAEWPVAAPPVGETESHPEGALLYRFHRVRERAPGLVRAKKSDALRRYGRLACEVCAFDFAQAYGEIGQGFIECHHIVPLAQSRPDQSTRLIDLALVCSNCHAMLHRRGDAVTIAALRVLRPSTLRAVAESPRHYAEPQALSPR